MVHLLIKQYKQESCMHLQSKRSHYFHLPKTMGTEYESYFTQ